MKKLIVMLMLISFVSACSTDPYTGESKVSKTAWGTGIGAVAGAGIGRAYRLGSVAAVRQGPVCAWCLLDWRASTGSFEGEQAYR